jgi:hypothetical protein
VRPVIAFAIYASGLKYVGLQTTTLGWMLCGSLLVGGAAWLVAAQPWRLTAAGAPASAPAAAAAAVGDPVVGGAATDPPGGEQVASAIEEPP